MTKLSLVSSFHSRSLVSFFPKLSNIIIGLNTKMIMVSIDKPFDKGLLDVC